MQNRIGSRRQCVDHAFDFVVIVQIEIGGSTKRAPVLRRPNQLAEMPAYETGCPGHQNLFHRLTPARSSPSTATGGDVAVDLDCRINAALPGEVSRPLQSR